MTAPRTSLPQPHLTSRKWTHTFCLQHNACHADSLSSRTEYSTTYTDFIVSETESVTVTTVIDGTATATEQSVSVSQFLNRYQDKPN